MHINNSKLTPFLMQAQQSDPSNPWSSTSGRIRTLDKFSVSPTEEFPTVRVEARIKVPQGEFDRLPVPCATHGQCVRLVT